MEFGMEAGSLIKALRVLRLEELVTSSEAVPRSSRVGGGATPAPQLSLGSQLLFAFKESGSQLVCKPSLLELVPPSFQTRPGAFIPDSRSQRTSSRAAAAEEAEPGCFILMLFTPSLAGGTFLYRLLHLIIIITIAKIIMTIIIKV